MKEKTAEQKARKRESVKRYHKNHWATDTEYREKRKISRKSKLLHNTEFKERRKSLHRIIAKTPKGKETRKRATHKRRRSLGFDPINDYFTNSNAHHINKTDVIYIPKSLHLAHSGHCLDKPETMHEINKAAFEYLTNNMKQL